MADRQKSFFDEPVALTLEPFREFDFAGVSSWSEIELYAVSCGIDVDSNFLNVICATAYCFDGIFDALLSELQSTSGFLDSLANSVAFVEFLFKVWTYRPARASGFASGPQVEIERWLFANGIDAQSWHMREEDTERKKYLLLGALNRKFPYLLVKFYALHSRDLRREDMRFVSWLVDRLERRAAFDARLSAVLKGIKDEARKLDRTTMYMM